MVTCALEESVPKTLHSVLEQSIPPTLHRILGETISRMLCNVLDGTFSEFTSRYESVGGAVVHEVKANLEMQQESLATDYSSVQSSLQEVLTCLRAFDQTIDSSPPNHPGSGVARNPTWSSPSRSNRGGDQVGLPGAQDNKQPHDNVKPTHDGNLVWMLTHICLPMMLMTDLLKTLIHTGLHLQLGTLSSQMLGWKTSTPPTRVLTLNVPLQGFALQGPHSGTTYHRLIHIGPPGPRA